MQKQIPLILVLYLISLSSISQKSTQEFHISEPAKKVENSLYSKILFLDSRNDTTDNGYVRLGGNNKKARIDFNVPLAEQLSLAGKAFLTPSEKGKELLFQLRKFYFLEGAGKGFCTLRASLYSKTDDKYQKLALIDTVVTAGGLDATGAILKKGSNAITDFIASQVTAIPADSNLYSLEDVQNIEELEKRKLYLYMFNKLADGLYYNYSSFSNQVPDKQAELVMKNETISAVKYQDESGKWVKAKTKMAYAVVDQGIPFLATSFGYFPIEKINNDFYCTVNTKVGPDMVKVATFGVLFGLLGTLMLLEPEQTKDVRIKIDHLNGSFIPVQESLKSQANNQ